MHTDLWMAISLYYGFAFYYTCQILLRGQQWPRDLRNSLGIGRSLAWIPDWLGNENSEWEALFFHPVKESEETGPVELLSDPTRPWLTCSRHEECESQKIESKIKVNTPLQCLPIEICMKGQSVKMVSSLNLHFSHPTFHFTPIQWPLFIHFSKCMRSHITLLKSRGEGVKSFHCNKEGPAYPWVYF